MADNLYDLSSGSAIQSMRTSNLDDPRENLLSESSVDAGGNNSKDQRRFDFCDVCSGLTEQIPSKSFNLDKSFVSERVATTCLDADVNQIAVGTNVGNVYIFDRRRRKMFTIKGRDGISCLKLSHNGEYQLLGVGLETGMFVAIQLPSSEDGKSRKLLQKLIKDVHRCGISCVAWSADGRKLFTGDNSGLIMMTLVDFENAVFDASFVYCDADHAAVVQLAHWGSFLAAATTVQVVLVDISDDCRVRSIGQHCKKGTSFKYGVTFMNDNDHLARPSLYVSRPGCRLWKINLVSDAQAEGPLEISETQNYQQSMPSTPSLPIPLQLQLDVQSEATSSRRPVSFGSLYCLARNDETSTGAWKNLLVTHDDCHLFLIDTSRRALVAWTQLRFSITDVAVCSSTAEIFVLFTDAQAAPIILRIGFVFADPWFITSPTSEKQRKKSQQMEPSSGAAIGVKEFLQKVKSNSTQLVNKSVDALSMKDLDSAAPNFQIILNKLRATAVEPSDICMGLPMEEFDGSANSATLGASASRSSTPESASMASGGAGTSLPPWCLEDQSMAECSSSTVSQHVRVTKGKIRNGTSSRRRYSDASSKKAVVQQNPPAAETSSPVIDDRLTTPTAETYVLNRFNPFDDLSSPRIAEATREQLEEMLDSSLLLRSSSPAEHSNEAAEIIAECVVKDSEIAVLVVDDVSLNSVDSVSLKKRQSCDLDESTSKTQTPPVVTSFRQLLLNEARVAGIDDLDTMESSQQQASTIAAAVISTVSMDDDSFDTPVGSATSGRDVWCQVNHHKPIIYVAGSAYYFAFVDVDQICRYFSYARNHVVNGDLLSTTDEKNDGWLVLQEKADTLCVSPNGRIVWRVLNEVAYAQQRPNLHSPLGRKWYEAAQDVSTKVAVSNSSAWYLKTDGTVCVQAQLRPDRPCYKIMEVSCDGPLVQLACTETMLWGLRHDGRLVVRIGIKLPDCQTGVDWIDFVPDGPSEVVALDLYEDTAWVIDTEGRLWFCLGVSNRHPIGTTGRWWQVALPAPLCSDALASSKRRTLPHAVCVTPVGVHVAVDRSIWYCRGGVTGHRWSSVIPSQWNNLSTFRRICVSCVFNESTDYVWLIRMNNDFMTFQPHSKRLQSLEAPFSDAEVVAISGVLSNIWTLDSTGRIFIRSGVDPVELPSGSRWELLDMSQFDGDQYGSIKMVHLSCSLDAVWACDQSGHVYVRLGLASLESSGLPSAWIRLDDHGESTGNRANGSKQRGVAIRKLFCSLDGKQVWALTKAGRIFVRLSITRDVPIGRAWTEIEDMKARTLAIDCGCAFALSENFDLYQRYGITDDNPTGNFWKPLGCKLRTIAITASGKLWGLDLDQRLVKHYTKRYGSMSNDAKDSGDNSDQNEGDQLAEFQDFEIV